MKKQCFNLVEIILALGVIAVGMTGVLVLFPTGLNSVNSATADNSAPDAVQYLAGYLESSIRGDWRNGVTTTVTNLPTAKPGAADLPVRRRNGRSAASVSAGRGIFPARKRAGAAVLRRRSRPSGRARLRQRRPSPSLSA